MAVHSAKPGQRRWRPVHHGHQARAARDRREQALDMRDRALTRCAQAHCVIPAGVLSSLRRVLTRLDDELYFGIG